MKRKKYKDIKFEWNYDKNVYELSYTEIKNKKKQKEKSKKIKNKNRLDSIE